MIEARNSLFLVLWTLQFADHKGRGLSSKRLLLQRNLGS